MTDKPNFILVNSSEIAKDPTHRLDPKYWIRKNRHNADNLILAKQIAKHLILHRIWNGLTQNDLAFDIEKTHQQYQKFESINNDIFFLYILKIFKKRKWDYSLFVSDPSIVLDEWLKNDYGNLESWALPDKYHKIIDAWKLLDLKAEKNYYKK